MTDMAREQPTTASKTLRLELPKHWLSWLAALVVVGVVGAVALSVGIWVSEGSPQVQASFGMPGGARPPAGQAGPPGGQAGQGGFGAPQGGQPGAVPQGGQNQGAVPGQPGFGGQGGQNQDNNVGAGILSRNPDLVGRVTSATDRSVTIVTAQGSRAVQITNDTVIYRADGSIGSLTDLDRNDNLAIVLITGRNPLTADELLLLP